MSRRPRCVTGEVIDKPDDRNWFKVRKYAVQKVRDGISQLVVAATLGVSQGFVSKWWNEFRKSGTWESLRTRSSRPKIIRTKKDKYAEPVIQLRKEHPELGAQKIKAVLKIDLGHQSIHRILVEAGLVDAGPYVQRKWRAFERKHANSLWQTDFKEFRKGGPYLLTFIDDHSRFVLASSVIDDATGYQVMRMLDKAIALFGKPRQILTDHGTQFYAVRGGTSEFDIRCRELGIKHIMAAVRKPTTNGKVERWHRTFNEEFYSRLEGYFEDARQKLPGFLEWYNTGRPHWALGLRTPVEVYLADFITEEDIYDA